MAKPSEAILPAGYFLKPPILCKLAAKCNLDRSVANTLVNSYEPIINTWTEELVENIIDHIRSLECLE